MSCNEEKDEFPTYPCTGNIEIFTTNKNYICQVKGNGPSCSNLEAIEENKEITTKYSCTHSDVQIIPDGFGICRLEIKTIDGKTNLVDVTISKTDTPLCPGRDGAKVHIP